MRYILPMLLGFSAAAVALHDDFSIYARDAEALDVSHPQLYTRDLASGEYILYTRGVDPDQYKSLQETQKTGVAKGDYAAALKAATKELALRQQADAEKGSDAGHVYYTTTTLPKIIEGYRAKIEEQKAAAAAAARKKMEEAAALRANNKPFKGWGHKDRRSGEASTKLLALRDAAAQAEIDYEYEMYV
ncbi:hypothetical protein MMC13_000378 [Lambiella insularis]|nr:hypothetical protein [Lambiella insularis]